MGTEPGELPAAFGGVAPLSRTVERKTCWMEPCTGRVTTESRRLSIAPELLVALGGDRFALLVLETDRSAAHGEPGAVSVAYLRHAGGVWHVERTWPEIAWSGSFGTPADRAWLLDRPGEPLFVIAQEYLGMDQGLTTFWIIALGRRAPRLPGTMPGGASHEDDGWSRSCGPYGCAADLRLPRRSGDVLSVRYVGWTAPPGHIKSKVRFSVRT